ncbi:MAG: response regulator [Methanobacterium sp. ERen5]|nr:MAG: response regulator [Methanobacterium sp. ERen5]
MSDTKILVVEDDKIISLDIQRVLNAVGYEVPFTVSTGEDAIRFAKELLPDLILMDISLKGDMDGIHAASQIKNLSIPIIFLTAYKNKSLIERAQDTDPYGYILKPYDEQELTLTIDMALKKHDKITKMEGIIQETPLPLFFINNEHEVVFWNKAMEKLSGTPINEIIGTNNHWQSFYDSKRPCMADLLMDSKFQMMHKLYSGKIDISDDSCSAEDYIPKVYNGIILNFSASLIKNIQGKIIGALEILDVK